MHWAIKDPKHYVGNVFQYYFESPLIRIFQFLHFRTYVYIYMIYFVDITWFIGGGHSPVSSSSSSYIYIYIYLFIRLKYLYFRQIWKFEKGDNSKNSVWCLGVFCTINCQFECFYNIQCTMLYIWIYFKINICSFRTYQTFWFLAFAYIYIYIYTNI